jgi:hypothetical protein
MREMWGPSFSFEKVAIELLYERLDLALREKAAAKKIAPYGINYAVEAS